MGFHNPLSEDRWPTASKARDVTVGQNELGLLHANVLQNAFMRRGGGVSGQRDAQWR